MGRFGPPEGGAQSAPQPAAETMWEMGGAYSCQTCEEIVYEALYAPETKELGWKCSKGHMSVVKGLNL